MNPIPEILGWSKEHYQNHLFDIYFLWCDLNTNNKKEMQAMICNQKLWSWFVGKHQKLELIFFDQLGSQQLSKAEIFELFTSATIQIRNYYPPRNILVKVKHGLPNVINFINN